MKRQPYKMVKHIQTVLWLLPTNCLSVFNHFMGLALKGLKICFSTILPLLQLKNFLDTAAIASPLQIIKKIEAS